MKTFKFLAVLMLAVVCVGLSSCSKDDDEKNDNSLLVGTWLSEDEVRTLRFNADGIGELAYDDKLEIIIYKFTYTFDSKTMLLTIRWTEPEEGEEPVELNKIELNGDVMKFGDMVFHKQ